MKHISLLCLFLLTSCSKQAKLDSARLESLLSGGQIDRIEVISLSGTNIFSGASA
ncbi:MAG TPA: hypothetical protein VK633_13950 [Verrucomicrobiae bacterium]|nr:hypothetical protein [Verrucomicrobiae bacterium]